MSIMAVFAAKMLAATSNTRGMMLSCITQVSSCVTVLVCADCCFRARVSGACMNPARAFGPAVVASHWNHHWIFWVGPTCGALVTVILVRYM